MTKSFWREDVWSIVVVSKIIRILYLGCFCALIGFHKNLDIKVFVPVTQFLLVMWAGNGFLSRAEKSELLSFQTGEWLRFIYNLTCLNHLLVLAQSSSALLGMLAFLPLLYQTSTANSFGGFLFLMSIFSGSYLMSLGFLFDKAQKLDLTLDNAASFLFCFCFILALRKLTDLERARYSVFQILVQKAIDNKEIDKTALEEKNSEKKDAA